MLLNLLASTTIGIALGWEVFSHKWLAVFLLSLTVVISVLSLRYRFATPRRLGFFWAIVGILYTSFWGYVRGPGTDSKKLFAVVLTLVAVSILFRWRSWWQIPATAIGFVVMALVYLKLPFPQIDLWYLQETAISLLGNGKNPYGIPYYAGVPLAGSWVKSLPYPPGHLLSLIPGFLLGDFRWSLAIAHIIASFVLYSLLRDTKDRWKCVIPVFFLFYPKAITYIWRSWTEPTLIAAMAVSIFAIAKGHRRLLILALGAALSTKQFGFLFVLALWVTRQISGRDLLSSIAVAVATSLPFLITDPIGLISGTVLTHLSTPPRPDSWSIPAIIREMGGPQLGAWVPFAALAVCAFLCRKVRGFSSALSVASIFYLVFFLMSPKAHENYFFTPFFLTLAAFAASQDREAEECLSTS